MHTINFSKKKFANYIFFVNHSIHSCTFHKLFTKLDKWIKIYFLIRWLNNNDSLLIKTPDKYIFNQCQKNSLYHFLQSDIVSLSNKIYKIILAENSIDISNCINTERTEYYRYNSDRMSGVLMVCMAKNEGSYFR